MSRRIALAQMNSTPNLEQNLRQASDLIAQARFSNASFVCLPENLDYIVDDPSHSLSLATPLHSNPFVSRFHSMAAQYDIWLSLGGLHELCEHDPSHMYNTHLIISPHNVSEPVAVYRKTHLFDVTLPDRHVSEHTTHYPGDSLVVAHDTPLGNVGLSTCYDLRFPSLYESLRAAAAHVLLVPSAFFVHTGAAHWHTLLKARAIDNQCYVAAAAQVAQHTPHRESFGHSMVVDPWGDVVVDAGRHGVALVCANLDHNRIETVRAKMQLPKQRRDDLLGKVIPARKV